MAAPVNDSYSAASGGVIAGGRYHLGAIKSALDSMNAGQWLDWSASTNVSGITDTTGPGGVAANWLESAGGYYMTNWAGKCAFDPVTKQIIVVGTAQGYTGETPTGAHSAAAYLDVMTGQFSKQWNPFARDIGHVYDGNPSMPMAGKMYRKPYNNANLYECNLATRVWTLKKSLSGLSLTAVCALEVFPSLGAAGSVMILTDGGTLHRYDVATDALSTIGTWSAITTYPIMHYSPAAQMLIFGSGQSSQALYKCSSEGAVSSLIATLPSGITGIGPGAGGVFVADPLGRSMSWLYHSSGIYTLDYEAGWSTSLGTVPAGITLGNSNPASIHGLGAVVFLEGAGRASSTVSMSQVWLHRVQ